jgi:hypothetical protein
MRARCESRKRKRILGLLEEIEDVLHAWLLPGGPSCSKNLGQFAALAAGFAEAGEALALAATSRAMARVDSCRGSVRVLDELDVQAQRLQLLEQHVERLRQPGLEHVLALDDRLVHARAADHVVRLDRQELLQRVGRAVGLHRPDFHLAEPLAAELRLAAQRLLGDQRVRADRARVDLVVDQVVQLQHVHDAHGDVVVERSPVLPSNSVVCPLRRAARPAPAAALISDLLGAVEHRRRQVNARGSTSSRSARPRRQLVDEASWCSSVNTFFSFSLRGRRRPLRLSIIASICFAERGPPSRGGSRGSARRSCGSARRAG